MKKIKQLIGLAFIAGFLNSASAANIESQHNYTAFKPSQNSWHFFIAPYGFIFGMNGDLTVKGNSSNVATTPKDVIENLDKIDAIFQLHAEASYGRWNFFIDPTYLKLTLPLNAGPISGTVSPNLTVFDYGAFFTIDENFNLVRPRKLQFMLAGRSFNIKNTLNFRRLPAISGEQSFSVPMLGIRYSTYINQKWSLVLRGDIGGFSIDDVKRTWDIYGLLNYAFNQNWGATVGMRNMGVYFERGRGANRFAMNTNLWGPMLGVSYRT